MRKMIFVVFGMLFIQYLSAQINYGLKGGLNLSSSKVREDVLDLKPKVSIHAGVFFEMSVIKNVSVKTEVLYSRKGYLHSVYPDSANYANKRFNYISVPVLIAVAVAPKLNILLGPEISVLAGAKSKYKNTVYEWYRPMSKIDKAIDLGFSYQFTNALGLEILYSHGFNGSEVRRYAAYNGIAAREEKLGANRVLQAGLLYKRPHKKKKM